VIEQKQFKRKIVKVPDDEANGTTILIYRHNSCMTQKELAEMLGISAPYLCNLEKGNQSMDEEMFNRAKEAISKYSKQPPIIK
jgi:predicted transcriptional regulator